MDPRAAEQSRGIKSIETGGRLLEVLCAASEPSELRVLAAVAGMSTSLTHAYLTSFTRMGLVQQDSATKRYSLGAFAVELGLSELKVLDPVGLALDAIGRLWRELDQTTALSVWGSRGPTVIRVHRMDSPLHATLYEGVTLPLRTTATGRAFCAFFPSEVVAKALRLEKPKGDHAAEGFDEAIEDARMRGLVRISNSPVPGLISFSAPVFNHAATMICALTVTGRAGSIDGAWNGIVARSLVQTARELSERLGLPGSAERALQGMLQQERGIK